MGNYQVYSTDTFQTLYDGLEKAEKQWIEKIRRKLEENPTGKMLTYSWFREKKFLNKRLYYLVDEETKKILFVSFASKKDQQRVIDLIKLHMLDLLRDLRRS